MHFSSELSSSFLLPCLPEPEWPLHRTTTPTSSSTSSSVSHQHSRLLAKLREVHFHSFLSVVDFSNVNSLFACGNAHSLAVVLFFPLLPPLPPPTGAYSTSVTGISIKPQPAGCLSSSAAAQTALKSPGGFASLFPSRLTRLEMLHIVARRP